MKCFNCNKIYIPKEVKARNLLLQKTCPWCRKINSPRQSLRLFKPRRK